MGMNNFFQQRFKLIADSIISDLGLPELFNYPFNYRPHPIIKYAAEDLQNRLEKEVPAADNPEKKGKMYGVLIAKGQHGKIGYFSAFSGNPDPDLNEELFVPPVFDRLREEGFFKKKEKLISKINRQIKEMENQPEFLSLQKKWKEEKGLLEEEFKLLKIRLSERKALRKALRAKNLKILSEEKYAALLKRLAKESNEDRRTLKSFKQKESKLLFALETAQEKFHRKIKILKEERKEKSRQLQEELFEAYTFLNRHGEIRNLKEIFSETSSGRPPAAAGECCLPKLLQYCFSQNFIPLAFGEFWWGNPPESEIRQHKNFYPACRGRCKPILLHMLKGLETEGDPLLISPHKKPEPNILFEDDFLLIVEKPEGLLSVPGRELKDSVYTRLKAERKDFEPLMLHRLDMHTSGLLLIAKTAEVHKAIQKQFLENKVMKEYTALLSRKVESEEGEIRLPLIADWMHRPRQRVDFEIGKQAYTRYRVVQAKDNRTRILFWPVTGRTHQLRVHAAHALGLNTPIVGDDLYGTPADRLCLHASALGFTHPISGEQMKFSSPPPF